MQDKTPPSEVSMAHLAQRAATYEDLLAVPEHLVAEILFGELVTHPRPAPLCSVASTALAAVLGSPYQLSRGRSGRWTFMHRPEVHLGPHVVVPDLAAWRRERLLPLPEVAWIDVAPDWVCEVLSPSTERDDRGDKRVIYAKAGVRHLWFADPRPKMLEVFELSGGKWLLHGAFRDNAEVAAPPFAEQSFSLGLLWPFDPPVEAQGSSGG
jgi:Uma2 family endonuclease